MIPFPDKKYNIIYADPPWSYNDKMKMTGVHGPIRGASSFYGTMPIESIKKLPIESISQDNAVLFLWATMPLLREAIETIDAWGFLYKTCGFTWIKTTKNGKIHNGMGHYTRGNAEVCLLGTRGKLNRKNASVSQVIFSQIRQHSQKPSFVRDKIIQLYGNLSRIELFARQSSPGWDVWGNEVNKFDGEWHDKEALVLQGLFNA